MSLLQTSPLGGNVLKEPLTLTVVKDFQTLQNLAPAWQELLESSPSPEPMLAPDWLLTWWQIYGQGRELCVGLFRDKDQLIGLAPLCRRTFRYRPGIPFRRLEPLGADVDEDDGVGSEYLNVIVKPGYEKLVAESLAQHIQQGAFGGWDELVFSTMDGNGPMPELLKEAFQQCGLKAEVAMTTEVPFLALPPNWDDYLKSLNKKKRQSLQFALRDFQEWAAGDFRLVKATNVDELQQGAKIVQDLHKGRWQAEDKTGAFGSARFDAFHEVYLPQAFQQGKAELLWLTVRGEPVAAHYSLLANGKVYFYQCGRKMDVPSKVRPGIVLLIFALQEAMAQGLREFDFLGGPAQYKFHFTSTWRPLVQVRAVRPSLVEWTRCWAYRSLKAARWLKARLKGKTPVKKG